MIDLGSVLDQMLAGVTSELQATSAAGAAQTLQLSDGVRVQHVTRADPLYRFHLDSRRPPSVGQTGWIVRGEETQSGATVAAREGHVLEFRLERDIGASVPGARFVFQDTCLLQWLQDRLKQLTRCAPHHDLSHRVISGAGPIDLSSEQPASVQDLDGLNPGQSKVVAMALKSSITVCMAPPGTGKTRTAGAIADAWIRRGLGVLMAAPTNVALDRVLLALLRRGVDPELLLAGRILRVGAIVDPDLESDFGDHVILSRVVARHAAPVQARLKEIARELSALSDGSSPLNLQDALRRRADLLGEHRRLDVKLEHLPQALIDRAQLIATTIHRAGLGWLRRSFDAVLIDEASMCSQAWTYPVLRAVKERGVFLGDPHQLGPIVRSSDRAARRWLGQSILEAYAAGPGFAPHVLHLDTQYRMNAKICRVVSEMSYEGTLKTHHRPSHTRLIPQLPGPVAYVNTNELGARCKRSPAGFSRINPRQAQLAAEIACHLAAHCPEATGAVLTPYQAQGALLRRALRRRCGPSHSIEVGTVHGLQGDAAGWVVLDLTDGPGLPPSILLRGTGSQDLGPQLLTVAMSRAEHHVVVVGDLSWLARAVPADAVLMRLLRILSVHGTPLAMSDFAGEFEYRQPAPDASSSILGDLQPTHRRTRRTGRQHREQP